ncbi:MAG: murein hydrolase activator EnvC family protein [Solirubrobacterales bacterium]
MLNGLRLPIALASFGLVALAGALSATTAPGQDLQEQLNETEEKLSRVESHEGVLTTRISHESAQLSRLQGEVADLRSREAAAAAELAAKQAELSEAQSRLESLRARLQSAITILEDRLVALYKSSDPDVLTVLLSAHGFDDLLERTEYFQRIDDQDNEIVARVRDLRNQMQETVNTVKAARNAIAERKAELEWTRAKLERRTGELAAARRQHRATLAEVRDQKEVLEGDLSKISAKIQERLAGLGSVLPAGPIRAGSGELIWPVNGPITSGFGMRWGRMHEGIDISAPTGTPIRAAKSGSIAFASYSGGYGNYTCITHGGGLATCYAHQSSFAQTSGSISQGSILGYVGSTGHSTGPHLHFEVRINGEAVDPLGYL